MAVFKGLIKQCEVCKTAFKVPQSLARVRTCSRECGYKIRHVANKKEKVALTCWECGQTFYEHESHAERRVYCSRVCQYNSEQFKAIKSEAISGWKNPEWKGGLSRGVVSANGIEYRRASAEVENEKGVRRKRAKANATPAWANLGAILVFYRQARRISAETGVKHHVDHIVPLTSPTVCGLHCEANLRIIPATENILKHNRTWPDMP